MWCLHDPVFVLNSSPHTQEDSQMHWYSLKYWDSHVFDIVFLPRFRNHWMSGVYIILIDCFSICTTGIYLWIIILEKKRTYGSISKNSCIRTSFEIPFFANHVFAITSFRKHSYWVFAKVSQTLCVFEKSCFFENTYFKNLSQSLT